MPDSFISCNASYMEALVSMTPASDLSVATKNILPVEPPSQAVTLSCKRKTSLPVGRKFFRLSSNLILIPSAANTQIAIELAARRLLGYFRSEFRRGFRPKPAILTLCLRSFPPENHKKIDGRTRIITIMQNRIPVPVRKASSRKPLKLEMPIE